MPNYAIRLTRSHFMIGDLFFQKIKDICDSTIWYQHDQDHKVSRTHVHGLIMNCKVSTDTLRNWIKESSNSKWERSDWSFKQKYKMNGIERDVDINFITYMSKGQLTPFLVHNVDDVSKYKDAWIQRPSHQQTLPEMIGNTEKSATRWEMLQDLNRRLSLYEYEIDERVIIEEIINVFRYNRQVLSRYKIRDMYDSYRAYNDNHKHSFIQDIYNLCHKV